MSDNGRRGSPGERLPVGSAKPGPAGRPSLLSAEARQAITVVGSALRGCDKAVPVVKVLLAELGRLEDALRAAGDEILAWQEATGLNPDGPVTPLHLIEDLAGKRRLIRKLEKKGPPIGRKGTRVRAAGAVGATAEDLKNLNKRIRRRT